MDKSINNCYRKMLPRHVLCAMSLVVAVSSSFLLARFVEFPFFTNRSKHSEVGEAEQDGEAEQEGEADTPRQLASGYATRATDSAFAALSSLWKSVKCNFCLANPFPLAPNFKQRALGVRGNDEMKDNEIDTLFWKACDTLEQSGLLHCLLAEQRLKLYGLYKQATVGNCTFFPNGLHKETILKWRHWKNHFGMISSDAKKVYASLVKAYLEEAGLGVQLFFKNDSYSKHGGIAKQSITANFYDTASLEPETEELFEAVTKNNVEAVRKILAENPSMANSTDGSGSSVLHIAADKGFVEILSLLLKNGSAIDCQDDLGDTPLHAAVVAEQVDAITFLLKSSADPSIKNFEGTTAIDESKKQSPEVQSCFLHA